MEVLNGIIGGILGLANVLGDGVFDAVGGILGWVVGSIANMVVYITAALPSDPLDIGQFVENIQTWETGIAWLNWFLPIGQMAALLAAWVGATLASYLGRIVLHFIAKINVADLAG